MSQFTYILKWSLKFTVYKVVIHTDQPLYLQQCSFTGVGLWNYISMRTFRIILCAFTCRQYKLKCRKQTLQEDCLNSQIFKANSLKSMFKGTHIKFTRWIKPDINENLLLQFQVFTSLTVYIAVTFQTNKTACNSKWTNLQVRIVYSYVR